MSENYDVYMNLIISRCVLVMKKMRRTSGTSVASLDQLLFLLNSFLHNIGSSNAAWDYFLKKVRTALYETVDPFLPFAILFTCNIIIIVKMVKAGRERARKLSQDSQQNVYGVLPTMLGKYTNIKGFES